MEPPFWFPPLSQERRIKRKRHSSWLHLKRLAQPEMKITSTQSYLQGNTLIKVHSGSVTCPQRPPPKSMLWTFKMNSIKDCRPEAQEKQAFAQSVKNYSLSVSMSLFVKLQLTVLSVVSYSFVLEMKSRWPFKLTKHCMSQLLHTVWEKRLCLNNEKIKCKAKLRLSKIHAKD